MFEQPEYKHSEEPVAFEVPTSGLGKRILDEIAGVNGFAPSEPAQTTTDTPVEKSEARKRISREVAGL